MSVADTVLDYDAFSTWAGIETTAGKEALQQQLREWIAHPGALLSARDRFQRIQQLIHRDPSFAADCNARFKELAEIEQKVAPLLTTESTKLEKESYNELLFIHPLARPLNFVPCLLTLWSFLRVYLFPGISFLFPLLTLIAPYFILTYVCCIPITFKGYMGILHSMISGNVKAVFQPDQAAAIQPAVEPIAFLKQAGMILVTVIQGIVQPYWTYKHLHSIDQIVQTHGDLLMRFRTLYLGLEGLLREKGVFFFRCPIPSLSSTRMAMAYLITEPFAFKMALKYIGRLEALFRLASHSDVHPVRWVSSRTPVFRLTDSYDFHVPADQRKRISMRLDAATGQHALLTGPNKGGKSTSLRSIATSALLAHTYGCALGHLTATPLSTMYVCLKPDDLPGSKSRFEREIEFTATTLRESHPALVLIDELYHSTNPPDALRSCNYYSDALWKKRNMMSVISTHLFEWVNDAPRTIQRLCCPAELGEKGEIRFSYELQSGVCTVSSVDSLLKANGFQWKCA